MNDYTESYYNTVNYHNYLERADRYKILARELEGLLYSLSLIKKDHDILDFGCAFGFLMEGFSQLGYEKVYGYEISDYARDIGIQRGNTYLVDINGKFDITFALDVFEHMTDKELVSLFSKIDTKIIIARIPCADYNQKDFYLDISKNDPTHINCKDKDQWKMLFCLFGYNTFLHLNLFSIYDTPGVFSFIAIKKTL
jgi:SAM-dependent methyltransferase